MSQDVHNVLDNLTYQVCTLCATTPTINGIFYSLFFFPRLTRFLYSCIAENETECPNCAREHGVIREIRQNNLHLADQHDVFLSEVQESGFDAIATAFGRGFMNLNKIETEVA